MGGSIGTVRRFQAPSPRPLSAVHSKDETAGKDGSNRGLDMTLSSNSPRWDGGLRYRKELERPVRDMLQM